MKKFSLAILIIILMCSSLCHAHPGRTDKYGGHTNKATGEYHYHNPDGTVTVAPKPAEKDQQTEQATQSEAENTSISDSTVNIIIDGDKKPVQQSVAETILEEAANNNKSAETTEIITKTDENGDTIIYIPKISPYRSINTTIFVLLIVLALIGWCAISPIICTILKKIEDKNTSLTSLLHVPYLLFWLPSLPGKALYKIYNKICPKKEHDIDDSYDDE